MTTVRVVNQNSQSTKTNNSRTSKHFMINKLLSTESLFWSILFIFVLAGYLQKLSRDKKALTDKNLKKNRKSKFYLQNKTS